MLTEEENRVIKEIQDKLEFARKYHKVIKHLQLVFDMKERKLEEETEIEVERIEQQSEAWRFNKHTFK